jgi:hypothetical protein
VYEALVLAVREHVARRRSRGVQVVLCEDLASALAGAIAVDALGSARVDTIAMPSVRPAPGRAPPANSVPVACEQAPADALVVATHEHAERIGAFASLALLEDVPPDLVYELATYRNAFGRVFPDALLTRRSSLADSAPRDGATRSGPVDTVRIRPRAAAPGEGGAASRPKRGRRGLV